MILICGLGNPGKEFLFSRHNLGFLAVDFFAKKEKFGEFSFKENLKAEISEKTIDTKKVILAKPQTFMNNSGKALKALKKYFFLKNKEIWIVHDDLDLPFGRMKISFGKESGGHKGVESIIKSLKTKNFFRFRIGIYPQKKVESLKDYVLGEFSEKEKKELKEILERFCKAAKVAILEGVPKAMTLFNR